MKRRLSRRHRDAARLADPVKSVSPDDARPRPVWVDALPAQRTQS